MSDTTLKHIEQDIDTWSEALHYAFLDEQKAKRKYMEILKDYGRAIKLKKEYERRRSN